MVWLVAVAPRVIFLLLRLVYLLYFRLFVGIVLLRATCRVARYHASSHV